MEVEDQYVFIEITAISVCAPLPIKTKRTKFDCLVRFNLGSFNETLVRANLMFVIETTIEACKASAVGLTMALLHSWNYGTI